DRIGGGAAVFGVVVGPLHVVEGGRKVNRAAQVAVGGQPAPLDGREVRQLGEGDVDLERRARVVDAAYRRHELVGQVARLEQLQECHVGVGVGRDLLGLELAAV